MSYLDWKVGDEVVCIKRGKWVFGIGARRKEADPEYGEVCVIASFEVSPFDGDVYITINGYDPYSHFLAANFRPVQKRVTDISIFTALLNPSDHDKHLIEVHDFVSVQGDLQ